MFAEAKKRGNVDGLEFTGPAIRAVAERIAREKVGKANAAAATAALNAAVVAAEATTGGAAAATTEGVMQAGGRGRGGRGGRGACRVAARGAVRTSWKTKAATLAEAQKASLSNNSELLARIALLEANQPSEPPPLPETPPALAQAHQPTPLIPPSLII